MSFIKLWPYRWLLVNFLRREIHSRYIGSVSGIFWALIHPLALLAVYALVFTFVFRVKFPEMDGYGFTVFVALGLWPWLAFQESVQRGTMAVSAGAGLVKKVAFPHELLVHSTVLATYLIHGLGFVLVLLVLELASISLNLQTLPLVILLLLAQLLWASGIALFLAALQVLIRDVEHFLAPLFMVWFYATPILYPKSMVPSEVQKIIALNPMSFFSERIRELLLHGYIWDWQDIWMLGSGVSVFLLGRWIFNRLSPHFEDFL